MNIKKVNDLNVHPIELQGNLSKAIDFDKNIDSIKIKKFLKRIFLFKKQTLW